MNTSWPSLVTVVAGLPRSGTSMMMQMLSAGGLPVLGDNVRQADEDNTRGYYEFEPVKRTKEDASWVADARGKVVKMVYALLVDLPADSEYRVLFMNRDLDEVLASQAKMLQRRGEPGASISNDRLRTVFAAQLAKVHAWLADQSQFAVLSVDYRKVIDDPQSEACRIGEFLGGGLDLSFMAAAVDPSLYRQKRDR